MKSARCRVHGSTERPRGPDELAIRERLVAKLHDIDAAAQRRLENVRVSRAEDEIEPHAVHTATARVTDVRSRLAIVLAVLAAIALLGALVQQRTSASSSPATTTPTAEAGPEPRHHAQGPLPGATPHRRPRQRPDPPRRPARADALALPDRGAIARRGDPPRLRRRHVRPARRQGARHERGGQRGHPLDRHQDAPRRPNLFGVPGRSRHCGAYAGSPTHLNWPDDAYVAARRDDDRRRRLPLPHPLRPPPPHRPPDRRRRTSAPTTRRRRSAGSTATPRCRTAACSCPRSTARGSTRSRRRGSCSVTSRRRSRTRPTRSRSRGGRILLADYAYPGLGR